MNEIFCLMVFLTLKINDKHDSKNYLINKNIFKNISDIENNEF